MKCPSCDHIFNAVKYYIDRRKGFGRRKGSTDRRVKRRTLYYYGEGTIHTYSGMYINAYGEAKTDRRNVLAAQRRNGARRKYDH